MNIDQIRADLAAAIAAAVDGVKVHDELPGTVTTPAVVVGLPTEITFEQSHTLGVVTIPITVVTGPMFNRAAETELMSIALAVAATIRHARTDQIKACRSESIDETTEIATGDQVALYSTNVNAQIITRHTE